MTNPFCHLLIAALRPEWDFLAASYALEKLEFVRPLYRFVQFPNALLLQSGPGQTQSTESFAKFLESYSCASVFHFGTCGGLSEGQSAGDLFLATAIIASFEDSKDCRELQLDLSEHEELRAVLRTDLPCHGGKLLTSATVLKNAAEKCSARTLTQAGAVDMESFGLAKLCHDQDIRYLSLRGIFDTAAENLESLGEPYDNIGNLSAAKISRNLLKNPKLIFTLPDLKKRLSRIQSRLKPAIEWYIKRSQRP